MNDPHLETILQSSLEARGMAGKIVRPVFGQPCYECGEQVPQARIRVLEADAAAKGHIFLKMNIVCRDCQELHENELRRMRRAERDSSSITIRR